MIRGAVRNEASGFPFLKSNPMLVLGFFIAGGCLIGAYLLYYYNVVKPVRREQKKKSDTSLIDNDWGKFKNRSN